MSSQKQDTKKFEEKFPQQQEGQWMQNKNIAAQNIQLGGQISGQKSGKTGLDQNVNKGMATSKQDQTLPRVH